MVNRLLRIVSAFVALFVFFEVLAYIGWKSHITEAHSRQARSMTPYIDAYEERLGIFRAHEMFRPGLGLVDAGEFLNDRVTWKIGDVESPHSSAGQTHFHLTERQILILESRGNQWPYELSPTNFAFINLDWMTELHRYDHWDVDSDSIRSSHFWKDRGSISNLPTPVLANLRHIGKIRLVQARNAEEVASAVRDLRQLARLLITTEHASGVFTATQILRDEQHYIHFYKAMNPTLIPQGIVEIPVRFINAFENAVRLNLSAFHLVTPVETFVATYGIPGRSRDFSLAVLTARHGISICAAINHNLRASKYVQPLLGSTRAGRYKHMKAVLDATKNSCRLKLTRAYWDQETRDIYRDKPYLYALPFGQWAVGSFLVSLGWPIFQPQGVDLHLPAKADNEVRRL